MMPTCGQGPRSDNYVRHGYSRHMLWLAMLHIHVVPDVGSIKGHKDRLSWV